MFLYKSHTILSFLMVFVTVDNNYAILTCTEIMHIYFPTLIPNTTYLDYISHIFETLVFKDIDAYEAKAYMMYLFKGIIISKIRNPNEFCDLLKDAEENSNCKRDLKNSGFEMNETLTNVDHAYYDVSIHSLNKQEHAQNYINYLMDHIEFDSSKIPDIRTPMEFCQKIETCSEIINKTLPEANNCSSAHILVKHIFENIVYEEIMNTETKEYLEFLFRGVTIGSSNQMYSGKKKSKERKRSSIYDGIKTPSAYCEKLIIRERVLACKEQIQKVGFMMYDVHRNIKFAYYKVSLHTLNHLEHAKKYLIHLKDHIVFDYADIPCGYTPISYCESIGKK